MESKPLPKEVSNSGIGMKVVIPNNAKNNSKYYHRESTDGVNVIVVIYADHGIPNHEHSYTIDYHDQREYQKPIGVPCIFVFFHSVKIFENP